MLFWKSNNKDGGGHLFKFWWSCIKDKEFRILNKSCNSLTLTQIPDDELETLYLEKGNQCPQKLACESLYNSETTPLTSLQPTSRKFYILDKTSLCTPNLQSSIAKFNAMKANLMTIKLLFYE